MGVSIRPSEFVEGGAVPVDRNLLWKECRFTLFDYPKKDGTPSVEYPVPSALIVYQDDDGTMYNQQYAAGGVDQKTGVYRYKPSKDGKTLEPEVEGAGIAKSSNYYILMNATVNAGFPESKLGEDISVLDGLYTHNIGIPEPKRSGLVREVAEGARERIISVPDSIIKLPWENKGKGAKAPPEKGKATTAPVEEDDSAAESDALAMVTEMLAGTDKVTRQQVAAKAIRSKKQPVAKLVFGPKFAKVLTDAGFSLDGEDITATS